MDALAHVFVEDKRGSRDLSLFGEKVRQQHGQRFIFDESELPELSDGLPTGLTPKTFASTLVHVVPPGKERYWIRTFLPPYLKGGAPPERWFQGDELGLEFAEIPKVQLDELGAAQLAQWGGGAPHLECPIHLLANAASGSRFFDSREVDDLRAWAAWLAVPANVRRTNTFRRRRIERLHLGGLPWHSAFYRDLRAVGVHTDDGRFVIDPAVFSETKLFVPAERTGTGEAIDVYSGQSSVTDPAHSALRPPLSGRDRRPIAEQDH